MMELRNYLQRNLPLYALVIATLAVSAFIIVRDSGHAPQHPMDQGFAYVDLSISKINGKWKFEYPRLQYSGGIAASLTVGAYKLLVPVATETLNWHVRILGAAMFLIASAMLLKQYLSTIWWQCSAFLVVALSGFQFLQPTTEIIAGAYFALFLVCVARNAPVYLTALSLVLFGLCKVELALASIVGLIAWAHESSFAHERVRRVAWFLLFATAFAAPAVYLYGASGLLGGRAFDAFLQHYVILVYDHQLIPPTWGRYSGGTHVSNAWFPGAHSMIDVFTQYPRRYAHFIGLSVVESAYTILFALHFVLLPFVMAAVGRIHLSGNSATLARLVIPVVLLALAPAVTFAFLHVRYVARFFPEIVLLAILFGEQLIGRVGKSFFSHVALFALWLASCFVELLLVLPKAVSASDTSPDWFWPIF